MREISLTKDSTELLETIKTLVEREFSTNVTDIKYIGGGSFGMVYKVTLEGTPSAVAFKVCLADNMHVDEARALRLLGAHSPIKIPKVYFTHDKDDLAPIDCLCMEFIEGNCLLLSPSFLFKSKKKRLALADELTTALHAIHQHQHVRFGDIANPRYDTWDECYRPFVNEIFNEAKELYEGGKLKKKVFFTMKKALMRYKDIFSEEVTTPCLIHGDLNVMNVMVKEPLTITAIIDPLNVKYSDFEYDLFQFNNMTGKRFYLYKTYKAKYPTSKNCDVKCAFYALWNEVYCLVKAGSYIPAIMNPLVKNMNKQLRKLGK